jgi:hypothetical protein
MGVEDLLAVLMAVEVPQEDSEEGADREAAVKSESDISLFSI